MVQARKDVFARFACGHFVAPKWRGERTPVFSSGLSAAFAGALAVSLSGCGEDEAPVPDSVDPEAVNVAVERGVGINAASYSGDVTLKIPGDLPIGSQILPFVLYVGLSPETDTRLGVNSFVDLRLVQTRLPDLASGVLEETCEREIALSLTEAEAEGNLVRARGTVRARFFFCNRSDPAGEKRGTLWLSQNVDATATAKATVRDQCIEFSLTDVELDPRGFLGGIANLFGLTTVARSVVLEEAGEFLSENPICATLPEELSTLAPSFSDGGAREIGDGGIGAALSGSVDTSAATIVSLLALMEEHGVLEGQH